MKLVSQSLLNQVNVSNEYKYIYFIKVANKVAIPS